MSKILADKNVNTAQTRYKEDYDIKFRFEPRFEAEYIVFTDRHPLKTPPTEHTVSGGYIKLIPQRLDLYQILSVRHGYLQIL